jgi:hypothetical protein
LIGTFLHGNLQPSIFLAIGIGKTYTPACGLGCLKIIAPAHNTLLLIEMAVGSLFSIAGEAKGKT